MKRILIIEDEPDIVDICTIVLEKEGYEVFTFTDFIGYQSIINAVDANLVLLDLNIRGHHGKEICRYIKQHDNLKQTKVILMSANPDIQTVKNEVEADEYISKPFDIEHLLATVGVLINLPHCHPSALKPDGNALM